MVLVLLSRHVVHRLWLRRSLPHRYSLVELTRTIHLIHLTGLWHLHARVWLATSPFSRRQLPISKLFMVRPVGVTVISSLVELIDTCGSGTPLRSLHHVRWRHAMMPRALILLVWTLRISTLGWCPLRIQSPFDSTWWSLLLAHRAMMLPILVIVWLLLLDTRVDAISTMWWVSTLKLWMLTHIILVKSWAWRMRHWMLLWLKATRHIDILTCHIRITSVRSIISWAILLTHILLAHWMIDSADLIWRVLILIWVVLPHALGIIESHLICSRWPMSHVHITWLPMSDHIDARL